MSETETVEREPADEASAGMSDDDILSYLSGEWESALGEGDTLETDRARALDYIHGDPDQGFLNSDLEPLPGLSKATSSDVSDAIETVLPDLMEIFTAGEDVMMFSPQSEEDEPQAEQETDYVNYVFYSRNEGWMTLYTAFKDALASKTGVLKWWWETEEEDEERTVEVAPGEEDLTVDLLSQKGWERVEEDESEAGDADADSDDADTPADFEPAAAPVSLRFRRTVKRGAPKVGVAAPEDFRVDPAAVAIASASWAGMKTRQRIYELIEQGLDPDLLFDLPAHSITDDDSTDEDARRFHEEGEDQAPSSIDPKLKLVEIKEYHAFLDIEGEGEVSCWRIITGADDTVILDKDRIDRIQFETLCPYPLTHQFYGRSLADLVVEVQKIKTMLMRLALNHAAFAVNPRPEVATGSASDTTIADLLDNVPGRPILSRDGQAVHWQTPPQLGFDLFGALEYFSTVGENRTGVVRNAQGLNPDTLHDTATGATELMSAAQRRVRMIARIFAECGLKRFFLGLHDMIVKHGDTSDYVRLRNGYVEVDPSKWGRRHDLTIDVGLGTSTKTFEIAFWQQILQLQAEAKAAGVAMRPEHFWQAVKRLMKAGNVRNPDLFFPNPATAQEPEQQQAPPPDPEVIRVEGELRLKAQKQSAELQLKQQQQQFEMLLARQKAAVEAGLAERAAQIDAEIKEFVVSRKLDIEEFKAASDSQTKTMTAAISARAKSQTADDRIRNVRLGGEIG